MYNLIWKYQLPLFVFNDLVRFLWRLLKMGDYLDIDFE